MSDAQLVAAAQRGEMQALGALYDQHHEALFRYLWARVGERQLAEDLTGDVFMRMLDALPRPYAENCVIRPVGAGLRAAPTKLHTNRQTAPAALSALCRAVPRLVVSHRPQPAD